jgi:hypothetical protein
MACIVRPLHQALADSKKRKEAGGEAEQAEVEDKTEETPKYWGSTSGIGRKMKSAVGGASAATEEPDAVNTPCPTCGEKEHVADCCPHHPQSLYEPGLSCKHCGAVLHFTRDCPTVQESRSKNTIKVAFADPSASSPL